MFSLIPILLAYSNLEFCVVTDSSNIDAISNPNCMRKATVYEFGILGYTNYYESKS